MTTPSTLVPEREASVSAALEQRYEHAETRDLVTLVNDAAELVRARGEAAFSDFRISGSRWRHEEMYIFVLDPEGNMLVHADPAMEGKNQLDLKDIDGKPVIRGLIGAATAQAAKPEGWYHYRWPVPGEILPRWKSSFVRLVKAPSGKSFIVGSGMYNDRMERAFVEDAVTNAVALIERRGAAAFEALRDPKGPFIAKDAYVFVTSMEGVELVNPAFPNLEGRDLLDMRDTHGKYLNREMIQLVQTRGSGWADYMWPKPGESVSTQKSAYVKRALPGGGQQPVMVGCGVYLAEAPRATAPGAKLTAPALMTLVREAAAVLGEQGENAFPELRKKGSKWFRDETYLFVYAMDGTRAFHAAEPETEGKNSRDSKDILGRPYGRMILETGGGPAGEGWVHYMYPEPGNVFPAWKSSFVKRVTFPSGKPHIVGCGIYHMQMDKAFIEDVVNRAAALIEKQGKDAFSQLRDKTGPFVFMDTYVFVTGVDGIERVNAQMPSLEGRSVLDLKDLRGKTSVRDEIELALKQGSAWLEGYWYRPGDNLPARKQTFVRKVQVGRDTYIVGSGIYTD